MTKNHLRYCLYLFVTSLTTLLFGNNAQAQIVDAERVDITSAFGGTIMLLDNEDSGTTHDYQWYLAPGSLEFDVNEGDGGLIAFRIENTTNTATLCLDGTGVGIGVYNPEKQLHIKADGAPFSDATIRAEVTNNLPAMDRNMLELWNNGPAILDFMDTSVAPAAHYQIRTASDRFSFQQFGGSRAGLVIFADGAVRFVANGGPNLTVTPNGSLNVVGTGSGGGNLNVGLGANIGPTDGNLFVKRNIQYNGQLLGPSDRNIKENFQEIEPKEVLAKVATLPITKWNYKEDENRTLHLGPMAQDFAAAFGLGDNEKRISMMDSDGVALAAIKGLNQIVEEKDKEIKDLKGTVEKQRELMMELAERLERLEAAVGPASK